ncbi:hypothetical protein HDV05_004279 [Chytridiales sp. JEL 0842]|nr:hypothetical protein HDV05_004279 [Chytridiales sp. JEL 0842]
MGSNRFALCHCLFWTKATFSFFLANTILAYYSWKVYDLHINAPPPPTPPVQGPLKLPTDLSECFAERNPSGTRLLPVGHEGKIMMGFSLDWSEEVPAEKKGKVAGIGAAPAVYNTFMEMAEERPNGAYDANMLNWFASEVQKVGGMLELTMAPTTVPIDDITDASIIRLAEQCRDINVNRSVPIFLRWGHEMNGDWTRYGYKPTEYKRSFRRVAEIMRRYTNMTAMVWAPNVGIAYPYTPGANLSPPPTATSGSPVEFAALDTNGNGELDLNDDPYEPYYPGDDVVDWVGISLYYYPRTPNEAAGILFNEAVPADFLSAYLSPSPPAIGANNDTISRVRFLDTLTPEWFQQRDFYNRYARLKNKPMMFPETGAPFLPEQPANIGEVAIKQAWWRQMYSAETIQNFPLLKLFVNFEERKVEAGQIRDWAVGNTTEVLTPFVQDMRPFAGNLVQGDRMKFECSGAVYL